MLFKALIEFIRDYYQTQAAIPLHAPIFNGNEREKVLNAIDSTFVSSVGVYVDQFEKDMAAYTQSPSAVVTVNGTSALHMALKIADVGSGDYVITQALSFVATCNAIAYCNAQTIFVDVDKKTLGLCPQALDNWLQDFAFIDAQGLCRLKKDKGLIKAVVPMHTFGHPVDLDRLLEVCKRWHLIVIEDAAESLGSLYKGKHSGTFGAMGIISFNGNKIITTGGGGMILSDKARGLRAKHLTTTAKIPHPYEYKHDELGYNYRMPNINAALGCAQLEQLELFIENKRALALHYAAIFKNSSQQFFLEQPYARSNYWLNALICEDKKTRDYLLDYSHKAGIMTRPAWQAMNTLPMYQNSLKDSLENTEWLTQRLVNLPSSVQFN